MYTVVTKDFLVSKNTDYAVDTTSGNVSAELASSSTSLLVAGEANKIVNIGSNKVLVHSNSADIATVDSNSTKEFLWTGNAWMVLSNQSSPGIKSIRIADNKLLVTLTDNSVIDAGNLPVAKAKQTSLET
jgi:hypothetical protein